MMLAEAGALWVALLVEINRLDHLRRRQRTPLRLIQLATDQWGGDGKQVGSYSKLHAEHCRGLFQQVLKPVELWGNNAAPVPVPDARVPGNSHPHWHSPEQLVWGEVPQLVYSKSREVLADRTLLAVQSCTDTNFKFEIAQAASIGTTRSPLNVNPRAGASDARSFRTEESTLHQKQFRETNLSPRRKLPTEPESPQCPIQRGIG